MLTKLIRFSLPRSAAAALAEAARALSLAFLLSLAVSTIVDACFPALAPYIDTERVVVLTAIQPHNFGEGVEVRVADVNTFRIVGKLRAELLVYVAHGYSLDHSYALGTGEDLTPLTPLLHPVLLFAGAIVKGVSWEGTKLAVTTRILRFSAPLNSKILVLITCPQPGIEDFARALVEHGAMLVAYTTEPIPYSEWNELAKAVVRAYERSKTVEEFVRWLQDNGFSYVVSGELSLESSAHAQRSS